MQNNYSYIYENAQHEHFERSIMSGYLTESKLLDMIHNNELSETQIAIAEGFYDRLKARGSQALGAVKGLGQQVAGGAKQFAGNAVQRAGNALAKGVETVGGQIDPSQNKLTNYGQQLSSQGQQQSQQAQGSADTAKHQSYLTNTVATIINDLKSLNIPISNPATLSRELSQVLVRHIQGSNSPTVNSGSTGPAYASNNSPQFAPRQAPAARPPRRRNPV